MKVTHPIPEYELVAPKEAVVAWKHNEVTRQVIEIVRQELDNSCQRVGRGETLGENVAQDTARAVGYTEGLRFLIETMLEVTRVLEDAEDEKNGEDSTSS